MLTAVKGSHSVKVSKLEIATGELERDLGKTASSLLKEKKARKAKSSEVRRLQRQIENDAGLVSRGIQEAKDALSSEFQACLAKISAFPGSLDYIRNRDLALATIEGGMAVTSVINFVQKDFGEIFPRWDFDVEDSAAENIIKVMFNAKPRWKWTMDCWEVTGTKLSVKNEVSAAQTESGVKEEKAIKVAPTEARSDARSDARSEASATVGVMIKEEIEKSFRDIADAMRDGFGILVKEIKFLGDRMEAVEKKVGITKKGTASNDIQIIASSPPKRGHEPGSESVNGAKAGQNNAQEPSSSKELSLVIAKQPEMKPSEQSGEPSFLVLDKRAPTVSDVQQGEARRQTKKAKVIEFFCGKSEQERKLAVSQQSHFKGNITAKLIIPNKRVGQGYDPFAPFDNKMSKVLTDWLKLDPCPSRFYYILRTPLAWLNDGWSHKYPEFKSDEGDLNGLGRRLPGGAWNYHAGIIPTFYQSMKVWGVDVDEIYAPVNFRNERWIAMWISISKRHIVAWDSIISHISREDFDVVMEPFVAIVPYLLVECAGSGEQRIQHTLEPYTYERVTVGVPQCRAGYCGVFALKYIECHALGMSFPPEFCNKNAKAIREKMALDIFKETPECHPKENEDNDENMGTYDSQD
ncbi:uncharacterized protein LOC125585834 [Brassica napus]|uniref:uncharacterized protein LOC125585834 n=1 Tax=Brassica napus TaxID=3708 RepID=UPI002079C402|nr:uncharacterized protein LOC125585834 [Brassica napus]